MDPEERRRLVDEAVAAARTVATPEEYERVWLPLRRVANSGASAASPALEMIESGDPSVRATGCDLLGLVCERFEEPRRRACAALVALAAQEQDVDVQWSIARALGATADRDAVPVLVDLSRHPDSDVRFQVAVSLPPTLLEGADERGVRALVELSRDTDSEVRNWATFGLGTQLDCDTSEVREALWARVNDKDREARDEAITGLARRRDRRVLPIVAERLTSGEAPSLLFDAAAFLADPSLLSPLRNYDVEDPTVAHALRWCDPVERGRWERLHGDLLDHVQSLLDERPTGGSVALWCDLDLDINMTMVIGEREWTGWVDGILDAAGGDPAAAAQLWIDRAEAVAS